MPDVLFDGWSSSLLSILSPHARHHDWGPLCPLTVMSYSSRSPSKHRPHLSPSASASTPTSLPAPLLIGLHSLKPPRSSNAAQRGNPPKITSGTAPTLISLLVQGAPPSPLAPLLLYLVLLLPFSRSHLSFFTPNNIISVLSQPPLFQPLSVLPQASPLIVRTLWGDLCSLQLSSLGWNQCWHSLWKAVPKLHLAVTVKDKKTPKNIRIHSTQMHSHVNSSFECCEMVLKCSRCIPYRGLTEYIDTFWKIVNLLSFFSTELR